jgi:hypothetical protein
MRISATDKLLSNGTINAAGNSATFKGTWTDQLLAYIKVGSKSGSNTPTLNVTVQSSPDGTNWFNLSDTVAITAAGSYPLGSTNFGSFYRLAYTLGGTNPVFSGVDIWLQTKGEAS